MNDFPSHNEGELRSTVDVGERHKMNDLLARYQSSERHSANQRSTPITSWEVKRVAKSTSDSPQARENSNFYRSMENEVQKIFGRVQRIELRNAIRFEAIIYLTRRYFSL
jgi:hypothetical protein